MTGSAKDPNQPITGEDGDFSEALNAHRTGFNELVGLRFVRATADEVIAELDVEAKHHQPYGLVHGGVHATLIETVISVGAGVHSLARGASVVGLENHTSFLHGVRDGTIRATARPLSRGRRTQVWEATVTDANGRIVATGRVRMLVLEDGATIAGEVVGFRDSKR